MARVRYLSSKVKHCELVLYNFLLCTRCKQKKAILLEEVSEKVFQAILDSTNAWQAELVVYLWQAKANEIKV